MKKIKKERRKIINSRVNMDGKMMRTFIIIIIIIFRKRLKLLRGLPKWQFLPGKT